MTKTKSTKRALLASALALVLCVSMLVGSTFAWFTDSVTTAGNTIQSGTLDVVLEMKNENNEWVSADGLTLDWITEDNVQNVLWEPGCTYKLPTLRIRNNGNLALKYQVQVTGFEGDAKLLDVIDFTGIPEQEVTESLLPGAADEFTIEGHMQETANNDYQNLSLTGISITVVATQYTYEKDSISDQYDAGAYLPVVHNAAELKSALENGESVKLGDNITLGETIVIPAAANTFSLKRTTPAPIVLDLNGFNITGNMAKDSSTSNTGLFINNGSLIILGDAQATIANQAINGASLIYNTGTLVLNSGNYVGAPHAEGGYPSYVVRNNHGGTVTLKGSVNVNASWGAFSNYNKSVLNIEDATITSDTDVGGTTYYLTCAGSGAVINIYDGEFTFNKPDANAMGAPILGVWDEGSKINVYGGIFDAEQGALSYSGKEIEIFGGTFHNSAKTVFGGQTIAVFVPEDYKVITQENGALSVKLNTVAATDLKAQLNDSTVTNVILGEDYDLNTYKEGSNCSLTIKDGNTLNLNNNTIVRPASGSGSGVIIPGNANVTIKNGTISNSTGDMTAVDVAVGATATFEKVNFVGNGDAMIRMRASNTGKTTIIFKDCTFTNAGVILSGMNGACEIDVQFIGCTFEGSYKMYDADGNALTDPHGNVHYTSRLINANSNYLYGNLSFDNCSLNYDASEYRYTNSNGAIEISGTSNSYGKTITLSLKDVTVNCENALPVKYTSSAYKNNVILVEEGTNTYTNNGVAVNHDGSAK